MNLNTTMRAGDSGGRVGGGGVATFSDSLYCAPMKPTIGEIIRTVRDQKGVTQDKLGRAIGSPYQQISRWEKPQDTIGALPLLKIAVALQEPLSTFLGDDVRRLEQAAGLSPRERALVDRWRALTTEQQDQAEQLLDLDAEGRRLVEVFQGIDESGRRALRAEAEKLWILNRSVESKR